MFIVKAGILGRLMFIVKAGIGRLVVRLTFTFLCFVVKWSVRSLHQLLRGGPW